MKDKKLLLEDKLLMVLIGLVITENLMYMTGEILLSTIFLIGSVVLLLYWIGSLIWIFAKNKKMDLVAYIVGFCVWLFLQIYVLNLNDYFAILNLFLMIILYSKIRKELKKIRIEQ